MSARGPREHDEGHDGVGGNLGTDAGGDALSLTRTTAPARPARPDRPGGRGGPGGSGAAAQRRAPARLDARVMLARYRRDVLLADILAAALAASLAIVLRFDGEALGG